MAEGEVAEEAVAGALIKAVSIYRIYPGATPMLSGVI